MSHVATLMRCVDMNGGTPRLVAMRADTPAQRRAIAVQAQLYRRYLAATAQRAAGDVA